ncbi:MAG: tRNA (N6-isopentenyl adenosine(37)-C2)-methylthiotransferase MiaB [Spirochaetaceae bacterium]
MKYHLVQLGCQMNLSDSERIRTVLEELGFEATDREEEANLLGIVACSVRQKAIDKVYSRIHKWNSWKNSRNLFTFVSGCILPADREKFLDRFDLLFGINELPELPEMIRQFGVVTPLSDGRPVEPRATTSRPGDPATDYWRVRPTYGSGFESYVPIQNGCDKMCTFCAVPFTRGREVSRPSAEILAEVRSLVEKGYKSITLLGQNVNSYGLDRRSSEITFPELLRRVGEIGRQSGQEFWIYFTSPHPKDMTDEVLEVIAAYDCLARQIHLPIQSGDDKVLIRMNRNYHLGEYRRVVESIRRILPEATLFTDIIVGFSGETEEQFENTRRAMEEFRYNMAYIAMYSPRPGAASARWEDDVDHAEKRRRLAVLTNVLQRYSSEYNRRLVGTTHRLLVDGEDRKPGYLSGKSEGRLIVRFPNADKRLVGHFVDVRITGSATLSLEGELVGSAEGYLPAEAATA